MLKAFHSWVARHPAEVVRRLRNRFGEDVLELADVRDGFQASSPLAIALVPAAIAEMLREVERDRASPRYATFSFDTEHRLEA